MNAIPIRFKCPSCSAPQEAAGHLAGRVLQCYQCHADFVVPTTSEVSGQPTPDQPDTHAGLGSSSDVELGL